MAAKAVVVFDSSGPVVNAEVTMGGVLFPLTNQDGYTVIPSLPAGPTYVKVFADGYKPYLKTVSLDSMNQDVHIGSTPGPPNTIMLPALSFKSPSRDRIINVMANFCNLRDAEDIPIFEPFIDYLITNNLDKANDWFSRLGVAGSTHINLNLSGDYAENLGWAPRYPIPGTDWTLNLDGFRRVLDTVLYRNFIPIVHLASDGQGPDPVGLTKGWQWGMDNLPDILGNKLKDYIPECLWNTGWDGCFANWSPSQTTQFLVMLRDALGQSGQIATEFSGPGSVGYIHLGGGGSDWYLNGMIEVDSFFIELNSFPPNADGVSQVATRMLGPKAKNTETSPYYLAPSRPRGDMAVVMFETCAYQAIRKQISSSDARVAASQCAYYGFELFGNGLPN